MEEVIAEDMRHCSFRPDTSSTSKFNSHLAYKDVCPVEERTNEWERNRISKLSHMRRDEPEEDEECTF